MTWQNTSKSANFYCSSVHDFLFADALKAPQIPSTQNISNNQKIVAKPSPTPILCPTLSQTLNKSPVGV